MVRSSLLIEYLIVLVTLFSTHYCLSIDQESMRLNENNKINKFFQNFLRFDEKKIDEDSNRPKSKKLAGTCVDPSEDYLDAMFSKHMDFIRKMEEINIKAKKEIVMLRNFRKLNDSSALFEETQCSMQGRNTTEVNQQSLCPWKYVTVARFDRFPRYRSQAKCTCSSCTPLGTDDFSVPNRYTCLPVLKLSPVLVRGDCQVDGFYSYIPAIESINIACTCGINYNMIIWY